MMTKKVPSFSWVPGQPDRNLDHDDELAIQEVGALTQVVAHL
jgi:hypothetical protein